MMMLTSTAHPNTAPACRWFLTGPGNPCLNRLVRDVDISRRMEFRAAPSPVQRPEIIEEAAGRVRQAILACPPVTAISKAEAQSP
jgi:hypothetical protein